MPMVNGKKFPYTAKGKADAALAYTKSAQDKDRQAVKDEYAKKYDPTIKQTDVVIRANRFLGDAEKERAAKVSNYQTRMAKKGAIADQNRWIAKGAAANKEALKRVAAKKKSGASGGWEGMTGMTRAQKIAEMRKAGVSEAAIKAALGE
jgi:hypothetical protein